MEWRDRVKGSFRAAFEAGQRLGIDVLPRHFYSEIPDMRVLRRDVSWKRPFTMVGVRGIAMEQQLGFLRECCNPAMTERLKRIRVHAEACRDAGHAGYGVVEADVLYAFICRKRPAHIFQIGGGVSTAVMLRAARDSEYMPVIECVDAYPSEYLRAKAKEGALVLIPEKAQSLNDSVVNSLPEDVLFFVDSSHTLGPAGEVTRIILEFLPRLKTGSWIHFHDIYFPYDYDRHVTTTSLFFQHESALLHAYLVQNTRVQVCASLSMLHYAAVRELQSMFPRYEPSANDEGLEAEAGHFPSATYLSVIGG